ncbi:hypothetical protein BDR26DRAFT_853659 [Obelidium mucronatum]|nr:hypothetical protein BDR26DRAFT_853659 [Obelidium mucronatum]
MSHLVEENHANLTQFDAKITTAKAFNQGRKSVTGSTRSSFSTLYDSRDSVLVASPGNHATDASLCLRDSVISVDLLSNELEVSENVSLGKKRMTAKEINLAARVISKSEVDNGELEAPAPPPIHELFRFEFDYSLLLSILIHAAIDEGDEAAIDGWQSCKTHNHPMNYVYLLIHRVFLSLYRVIRSLRVLDNPFYWSDFLLFYDQLGMIDRFEFSRQHLREMEGESLGLNLAMFEI